MTPHLKDTLPDPPPQQYLKLTSQPGASLRFVKTLDSPSCQCRLCPKAGGKRAPGPEDRGWKTKFDETENRHSSIILVEVLCKDR